MRLTELQRHKLQEAHKNASDVLREVKQKKLRGKELENMKILEVAVQHLEVLFL